MILAIENLVLKTEEGEDWIRLEVLTPGNIIFKVQLILVPTRIFVLKHKPEVVIRPMILVCLIW